jgi:2'-5' RNA ligase
MRTFIAIPLPTDVRARLSEVQSRLRAFGADVRWTATPSIHLTLMFLGEIDPAVLPVMVRALHTATLPELPFELRLHGLGSFPNPRNPRVIWCGLTGDLSQLQTLQQKVAAACLDLGFAAEERRFQPHLTLGRVKGKSNLQPLMDYITITPVLDHGFRVGEYCVYQSALRPQGAEYSVLEKIELKGESR